MYVLYLLGNTAVFNTSFFSPVQLAIETPAL